MSDPRLVPDDSTSQAVYAYGDRACLVAGGGLEPTYDGTDTAIGAVASNVDLDGKVFLVVRIRAVDQAGTALTAASPRIGFATSSFDWRTITSPPYLGLASDSWAFEGRAGGRTWHGGSATAYGTDLDHGDLLAIAHDAGTGETWYGSIDEGTGVVAWFGGGDPVAATGEAFTVSGSGIRFGCSDGSPDELLGLHILTAAEATALSITPPTGYTYATDGGSSGTPDAPTSVEVIAQDTDQLRHVVQWGLTGSGVGPEVAEIQVSLEGGAFAAIAVADPLVEQVTVVTEVPGSVRFRVRLWTGAASSAWTEQAVAVAPTPALAP